MMIHIEWGTGYMNINADVFFPCSMAHFRILLKTIKLDYQHCDEIKENLKVYFQNKIPELPKQAEKLKQEASRLYEYKKCKTQARKLEAEAKRIIEYEKKFKRYIELL